jgi:hypothetical protein
LAMFGVCVCVCVLMGGESGRENNGCLTYGLTLNEIEILALRHSTVSNIQLLFTCSQSI